MSIKARWKRWGFFQYVLKWGRKVKAQKWRGRALQCEKGRADEYAGPDHAGPSEFRSMGKTSENVMDIVVKKKKSAHSLTVIVVY